MSNKKIVVVEAEEEEETAPFWMISFSDLMTLLMAFFVLLFSISTVEQKKMEAMVDGMAARFALHGSRSSGNKAPANDPNLPKVQNSKDITGIPELKITPPKQTDTMSGTIVFFPRGSYELSEQGKVILKKLSEQLRGSPSPVRVEGHASRTEIGSTSETVKEKTVEETERHVDDWAYNRACNVRDYLVSQGLKMNQITLVVIGQYHPLNESGTDDTESKITEAVPTDSSRNSFVKVIEEHPKPE